MLAYVDVSLSKLMDDLVSKLESNDMDVYAIITEYIEAHQVKTQSGDVIPFDKRDICQVPKLGYHSLHSLCAIDGSLVLGVTHIGDYSDNRIVFVSTAGKKPVVVYDKTFTVLRNFFISKRLADYEEFVNAFAHWLEVKADYIKNNLIQPFIHYSNKGFDISEQMVNTKFNGDRVCLVVGKCGQITVIETESDILLTSKEHGESLFLKQ